MLKIFDRLVAMGYSPTVIRGQVVLDCMYVHTIVDCVPISLTRRRYSNTTFCWADAYVGGWFSLGDPWQKVTPSAKDLSDSLRSVQEKQFAVESGTSNSAS